MSSKKAALKLLTADPEERTGSRVKVSPAALNPMMIARFGYAINVELQQADQYQILTYMSNITLITSDALFFAQRISQMPSPPPEADLLQYYPVQWSPRKAELVFP